MTSVVISQPMLFPWPGFFELVAQADVYVHLDDAQFSRGGFTNRVQIKTPKGRVWMTIPLAGRGSFQPIRDLAAADEGWKASHRELVRQATLGAPHAGEAMALFDEAYAKEPVSELLITSVEATSRRLGLARPQRWLRASGLAVAGTSWRRVLDLVKAVGGTTYVTAHGARSYLDHEAFEQEGVAVRYVDYGKAPYGQRFGDFTPYVSTLDLIAAEGPAAGAFLAPRSVGWRDFIVGDAPAVSEKEASA